LNPSKHRLTQIATVAARFLIAAVGLVIVAVLVNIFDVFDLRYVDDSYYPKVMAIWYEAGPDKRDELMREWAARTDPFDGYIGKFALHDFLTKFGYCSNLWETAVCKELPSGVLAQGDAKDWLLSLTTPYRRWSQGPDKAQ
jgi:hypothetical protein